MESTDKQHRDYDAYIDAVGSALDATGVAYERSLLGRTPEGGIYLFRPVQSEGKRVLVISGQHGEEIAGPWALLEGIRKNTAMIQKNDISFLPVGNPHGFRTGIRDGSTGKKTNWVLNKNMRVREDEDVGPEAWALIDNRDLLCAQCASDGLLNIHEDNTSQGFYLYVLGNVDDPAVSGMLLAGRKHFEFKKNGRYTDNGTYELESGVIDNHPDFSFDHYAYLDGVPLAITMELPAKDGVRFEDRVAAGAAMMGEYLRGICGRG